MSDNEMKSIHEFIKHEHLNLSTNCMKGYPSSVPGHVLISESFLNPSRSDIDTLYSLYGFAQLVGLLRHNRRAGLINEQRETALLEVLTECRLQMDLLEE